MKLKILSILALSSLVLSNFQPVAVSAADDTYKDTEWNNKPEVFQINREASHAALMPYQNTTAALKGDQTKSPFYKSLNG
ncbi:hypothetical protein M3N64_09875, partial [Sporolactobacillus sp. CPB3-1]